MFKNRNIKQKFTLLSQNADTPLENIYKEVCSPHLPSFNCFGEILSAKSGSKCCQSEKSFVSYNTDDTSSINDFDIVSFDKSSSSSISWTDEGESETTKTVQNEFDRMERVLHGVEEIPKNYDRDEYDLWRRTFPHFRVSGLKIAQPVSHNSGKEHYEEIIASDYQINDCDLSTSKQESKHIIRDDIYKNISSRAHRKDNQKSHYNTTGANKNKFSVNDMQMKLEEVLRISPIHLNEALCTNRRNNSSKLVSRQFMASNWLHDDSSREFTSLPHLPSAQSKLSQELATVSAKMNRRINGSHSKSPVFRLSSQIPSLPPIANKSSKSTADMYRSISATPRDVKKSVRSGQIISKINDYSINR